MTSKRQRVPQPRQRTGGDTFHGRRPGERPYRGEARPPGTGRGARKMAGVRKHAGLHRRDANREDPSGRQVAHTGKNRR